MPPASYSLADHEADDVLQEQQRNAALAAQFDEVRGLQRAFGKQDAVVADDADRHAVEMREAGDEGGAVQRLELVELGAVDDARDHLAHVVLLLEVDRHHAVELGDVERRLARAISGMSTFLRLLRLATMRRASDSA